MEVFSSPREGTAWGVGTYSPLLQSFGVARSPRNTLLRTAGSAGGHYSTWADVPHSFGGVKSRNGPLSATLHGQAYLHTLQRWGWYVYITSRAVACFFLVRKHDTKRAFAACLVSSDPVGFAYSLPVLGALVIQCATSRPRTQRRSAGTVLLYCTVQDRTVQQRSSKSPRYALS